MALSAKQKLFFFVGLNIAIYGISLIVTGCWANYYWPHGASGAVSWCGVILIMCGIWDIIIAIDWDPKQEIAGPRLSGLVVNLGAAILGILIISFSSWAASDIFERGIIYRDVLAGGTGGPITLYASVVLMGTLSFLLGLIALMYDCCCGAMVGPGIAVNGVPPVGVPGQFGSEFAPSVAAFPQF